MSMSKNTSNKDVKISEPKAFIFGEDVWKLITKYTNDEKGIMKSTKAMDYGTGVVLQVTTQQRNPDGSYAVAEAVTNVPGVTIEEILLDSDDKCTARKIIPIK